MKEEKGKYAINRQKDGSAILLSFCKVRILHYAAATPIQASRILERLHGRGCSIDASALNRILIRMSRNGWLKTKSPPGADRRVLRDYSLTPEGREVFTLAQKRLKDLLTALATRSRVASRFGGRQPQKGADAQRPVLRDTDNGKKDHDVDDDKKSEAKKLE